MNYFAAITSFLKESGMRKVGSCIFVFAVCAFLLLRKVLPSADFVTITLVVLGGIVGGNALEHAINKSTAVKKEGEVDEQPAPVPQVPAGQ